MKNFNTISPFNTAVFKTLFTSVFSALLLLVLASSALGQGNPAQPVARLINDVATETNYSRARRVNPEPKFAELDEVNPIERRAFEETNQARVKNGLTPLVWDSELWQLARAHSEHMAIQKFFAHETPAGLQLKDRARANQIRFRVIGENIAYNKGYADPGGFAVERWMISSGHRANILYAGFQAAAIGSYVGADGSTYLTQIFISR